MSILVTENIAKPIYSWSHKPYYQNIFPKVIFTHYRRCHLILTLKSIHEDILGSIGTYLLDDWASNETTSVDVNALVNEPMANLVSFRIGACDVKLVTPKGRVQLSAPLTTERLRRKLCFLKRQHLKQLKL